MLLKTLKCKENEIGTCGNISQKGGVLRPSDLVAASLTLLLHRITWWAHLICTGFRV
jgi:hypothetical protein